MNLGGTLAIVACSGLRCSWDSCELLSTCLGLGASLVAQMVKNLLAVWETQVWSLGREDPLEKGMATHSSILAWRIPWSLVGYSPWGWKGLDTTERLTFTTPMHSINNASFTWRNGSVSIEDTVMPDNLDFVLTHRQVYDFTLWLLIINKNNPCNRHHNLSWYRNWEPMVLMAFKVFFSLKNPLILLRFGYVNGEKTFWLPNSKGAPKIVTDTWISSDFKHVNNLYQ